MPAFTTRRTFLRRLSFAPLALGTLRATKTMSALTLYVGTYTDGDSQGIYRCRMDAQTGALEMVDATGMIINPSYLALHPSNTHLYAVSETTNFRNSDGGVFAYAIDPETHALQPINSQSSRGGAPCYISATPEAVLVANYLGGNVAVLPIRPDGGLAAASDVEQHEGSSVNEERQEAPHAHFIAPDKTGRHALVADLGTDEVVIYRLGVTDLERVGAAELAPGAGPRHLAFHPTENLVYVINELDSTVTSFTYENGTMDRAQTVSTVPRAFRGENFCADIHVSADGRFVYGSNRGNNSIAVFRTQPGGGLRPIQHISAGGSWPRNFAIAPSGRHLLVANQRSNNVVVFAIDPDSGRLTPTDYSLTIPSPVCLRFLDRTT